jgi:ribonuclease-3
MRIIRKYFQNPVLLKTIFFDSIQKILGFAPLNLEYYQKAFTHRSSNRLDVLGIQLIMND